MHVFVTGGTGYIGSAVVAQLIAAGHGVSVLARSDRSAAAAEAAGATVVRGDLTDEASITAAAASADAAIHLAAIGVADVLTQRDVADALSRSTESAGAAQSWSLEDAQAAFGALADAMALDQVATGAKARCELGWQPQHADARAGLAAGA